MPDITIDKSSLVYDDNEFEYKTRVPGTFGEDIRYLWIKKDDVDEINEGKTILTSLDDESKYMLYDKDDNLAETVRGSELYINHYDPVKEKENTESKNFDTINEKKSKSVGAIDTFLSGFFFLTDKTFITSSPSSTPSADKTRKSLA